MRLKTFFDVLTILQVMEAKMTPFQFFKEKHVVFSFVIFLSCYELHLQWFTENCIVYMYFPSQINRKYEVNFVLQCVWRCFAADPSHHSEATWKIHIHDASNEENMLARMARRASLTLRKRRSSRMDSLGNHYRESMSSVCTEDKLGRYSYLLSSHSTDSFRKYRSKSQILHIQQCRTWVVFIATKEGIWNTLQCLTRSLTHRR
jgi:hypothetical protein